MKMEEELFTDLVEKAVNSLPERFLRAMDNVDIVVKPLPSSEEKSASGTTFGRMVLGLYQGVPLSKRNSNYSRVLPDKITIYKNNIEKLCGTENEVVHLVRRTVEHELAHHFGFSDEQLKDLDLY